MPDTRPARASRRSCDIAVIVVDDTGRRLPGRIANISNGGFMAECEGEVPPGSIVRVDLPDHGPVEAEVRWTLGTRFGALILGPAS